MNFYIVIPVHNEEDTIGLTLDSLVEQSILPKRLVVVNDNSTDNTQSIIETYSNKHNWITLINNTSSNQHLPGSKVVNAFNKGLQSLDDNFDVICKFDADIMFPINYIEKLQFHFLKNPNIGIVGGLLYVSNANGWIYENISNKNHVRGPIKAYRKKCFEQIGGIKPSIGWDTVDTLLAKYFGWNVFTDSNLMVKHLKPTGMNYNKASKYLQGEALYIMRYGIILSLISALKMAYKKGSFKVFLHYIQGYFKAKGSQVDYMVTIEQGQFIRKLRWKGILNKFLN